MHWSIHWIAALAIGLAGAGVATSVEARASQATPARADEGVVFGIEREQYLAQARAALQGDPVIATRIGAIRALRLDDAASLAEPGEDVLVLDLEGSKANGRVSARFRSVDAHREALGPGTLTLADGSEHAIGGDAGPSAQGLMSSLMDMGMELFTTQAREAVQRYPQTAQHLGRIQRFTLDADASMNAEGGQAFVFDVVGSEASGRIAADFITVDADTERLGPGTLTLADGRVIRFEGEAPMPGEQADEAGEAYEIPDDSPFVLQAREAVQRYPQTAQHLGRIERFQHSAAGTMEAEGMLAFVFDVVGSKASGRIAADFITVDADTERLGPGTLTLADGRVIRFEGEAPMPGEQADDVGGLEIPDDSPFVLQAREAVQRHAPTADALGAITAFKVDSAASFEAEGMETFVFDVAGSKASGRLVADFITVDADTERLGPGTLTLTDGRVIRFEGEAPLPQESADEAMSERFAAQDSAFVQQAIVALRAHPLVRRHVGEVREARIDRDASWSMPGDQYAFDLVGSKGDARLEADFITVDADTERLGAGTLILGNGRRISLEDR